MKKVTIYDKAKYHYQGNFPEGLAHEQAYVHTGLFLGWIVENKLYSQEFEEETQIEREKFSKREWTGTDLYKFWDGVFASDMLNKEGNAFTHDYFDFERGDYIEDYLEVFPDIETVFHVEDTWENYDKLKEVIDKRYIEWKKKN